MLGACLGLEVRSMDGVITFQTPQLPMFIDWLSLRDLGMPGCGADLLVKRHERHAGIEVLRKDSRLQVSANL